MSEAQMRITEISISQRIAHNLARYKAGQSRAYTVPQFIHECYETMEEFDVPSDIQVRIMERAQKLMLNDLIAIKESKHLKSDGASECTAYAMLCGPITMYMGFIEAAASNQN